MAAKRSNRARAERIPWDTVRCDRAEECDEPAEWRFEDGAQLCTSHSQRRFGISSPSERIADLQARLREAEEDLKVLKRRMGKPGWETALLLRKAEAERDAAIERWHKDAGRAWEMYLIAMMTADILYGRQLRAERRAEAAERAID